MSLQKKAAYKTIAALSLFAIGLMSFTMIWHKLNPPSPPLEKGGYSGSSNFTLFQTARDIQPFELVSDQNKKFTQADLQNHWTLMFFGFTHCPHICPTTMTVMSEVYPQLQAQYPNLQVVLVTVDSQRDTTKVLHKYVQSFHKDFIGVTGTAAHLQVLEKQLGVSSERKPSSNGEYGVEHTASIFLINPQGKWAALFPFGMKAAELQAAIEKSVKA